MSDAKEKLTEKVILCAQCEVDITNLNDKLAKGWSVKAVYPLTVSSTVAYATGSFIQPDRGHFLVVLVKGEKSEQ